MSASHKQQMHTDSLDTSTSVLILSENNRVKHQVDLNSKVSPRLKQSSVALGRIDQTPKYPNVSQLRTTNQTKFTFEQ